MSSTLRTPTRLRSRPHAARFGRRLGVCLGAAVLVAACSGPEAARQALRGPRVVASIFPLGDLAASVGGPDVAVDVLVPPRADPSTFEPPPRRMQELADARV